MIFFVRTKNTTQLLVVGTNQWIKGPDLPKPLHRSTGISFGNDFIAVGGFTGYTDVPVKTLYKLSCANLDCQWTLMNQELEIARAEVVAIPIPDNMTACEDIG